MPNMMSKEEMKRRYKPRRPGTTLEDVVTPEERKRREQDLQEVKDAAASESAGATYNQIMPSPDRYAKGGMTASKRADGIAQRGKTRGTIVMCGGGMAKK
jgi:hypothetical protein